MYFIKIILILLPRKAESAWGIGKRVLIECKYSFLKAVIQIGKIVVARGNDQEWFVYILRWNQKG